MMLQISVLDHDPPHLDGLDPSQVSDQPFGDPMFDAYGDFNERIIANLNILLDAPPGDCGSYTSNYSVSTVNLYQSSPQEPDWNALRPFFAWTSPSSIKDTFNVTTRHGTAPHTLDYIKKHFKSRNPVFNIPRHSEAVATDTIFSDTPAVDDGSTMAQFFCGRDTLVCDAYGIKSTKQFINTLSDNIRKRGAMDTLISDGGKYEISKRVTDLLRSLFIQDYQSEPYHQHQNKAENRFGPAKHYTNTVMNTSGCTACCWLLCLQYICVVLNHLASPTLQAICPVQAPEGTNHKGSKYSVMVEWESGEVTYEPLTLISKDDPITCAVYAKKHDLLDTTGWKHLKRYAKTSKRLIRAVKQSRIRQVRTSARYQHGFQVPKDYNDAMRLDKENGNTHWQDAMDLELTQIHEYKVFKDTGKAQFHNGKVVIPDGFQKIRVHFVYAVKHDGRFKARLVADGHLTKEPVESIYSGVVSLRSLRMVVFLSQLNNLEIWGADVGNAYLEAYTDESYLSLLDQNSKNYRDIF